MQMEGDPMQAGSGATRSRRVRPVTASRLPRWVPMAGAMGSLLLLYGCWQVFGWTPGRRPLFGDLFFYPVVGGSVWSAWRASRRCAALPRVRSAWRLITLASVVGFGAEIAQTVADPQEVEAELEHLFEALRCDSA